MEDYQEFAGHLKAELLEVRDKVRHQQMSEAEARKRIGVILIRARSGDDGYLRPRQAVLFQAAAS